MLLLPGLSLIRLALATGRLGKFGPFGLRQDQTDQGLACLRLEFRFGGKYLQFTTFRDQEQRQHLAAISGLEFFQAVVFAEPGFLDDGFFGEALGQGSSG